MSYRVEIKSSALKALKKLPKESKKSVGKKIKKLVNFPKVSNVKKLSRPLDGYRLRVGKYRVLFTADSKRKLITIYIINHRKAVYKS